MNFGNHMPQVFYLLNKVGQRGPIHPDSYHFYEFLNVKVMF